MNTRYDRMRAAAAWIDDSCGEPSEIGNELRADADELEREIEALRRDAARYRFIRSGKCHVHAIWFQSFGERFNLMESDLDDSVDAALAANGEKGT